MEVKLCNKSGSAMVEAAIVLPVLFLIIAMLISKTVQINMDVGDGCASYESETASVMAADPNMTEAALRIRWLGERK